MTVRDGTIASTAIFILRTECSFRRNYEGTGTITCFLQYRLKLYADYVVLHIHIICVAYVSSLHVCYLLSVPCIDNVIWSSDRHLISNIDY